MKPYFNKLLEVKERVSASILGGWEEAVSRNSALNNILGVGIGYKNGHRGGVLSVRVYVRRKLPALMVLPSLLLEGFLDGVLLDVVQMRPLVALSGGGGAFPRGPACPGSSIRMTRPGNGPAEPGCIGAVMGDASGKQFIIGANHVLWQRLAGGNEMGLSVEEFGPPGASTLPARRIASRVIAVPLGHNGSLDCAVAALDESADVVQKFPAPLANIQTTPADLEYGSIVHKVGHDGVVRRGVIHDVFADVKITYSAPLPSVMLLRNLPLVDDGTVEIPDRLFAIGGDSGAVVFREEAGKLFPAGLVVGGPNTDLDKNGLSEDFTALCSYPAALLALRDAGAGELQLVAPV